MSAPEPSAASGTTGPHDHAGDGHHHHHGEQLPAPSGPGTVVLDIGPGRGALTVRTPEVLDGREIEIRPAEGEWLGEHMAVRPRPLPVGTVWVAVFDSLPPGRYQLRERFGPDEGPVVEAEVEEARVRQVRWPGL